MPARLAAVLAAATLLAACARPDPIPPRSDPAPATAPTPIPQLAPLAPWIGGRWVGEVESGGRKFTTVRTYEWSFDRRVIVGRSFALRDGTLVQTRETPFFWNADAKRIEFLDFIDTGGYGVGWAEATDGQLYMEATIVGNAKHPAWRAWVRDTPEGHVIRVEAQRDGVWSDFGTYPYRRER